MRGILVLGVMLSSTMLTACSFRNVPPGSVGVKVYMTGGSKGVDHEAVGVGWQFLSPNTQLFLFPTFKQNYVWTRSTHEGRSNVDESISFQTREGLEVNADIGITYEVDAAKVSILFMKYRKGLDDITDTYLRNYVRDAINAAASKMDVESVYGEGKTDLLQAVQNEVSKRVIDEGIKVEKVYLIGQFRLPSNVLDALNSKITATQRAQQSENEVAQARAEAQKQVATAKGRADSMLMEAKAEAEANRLRSSTISESLIKLEMAKRWDGAMPAVMGSGAMPMFDAKELFGKKISTHPTNL